MREEPLVRGKAVGRAFDIGDQQVRAVRDASFSIDSEARIALVGPSGSGKSTLLHLIAGLDRPSEGSITWTTLGPRDELRPGALGIAFQGPSLLPPLTVLENIAFPMILTGRAETDATADAWDLAEIFKVQALADRLPEELSGGQSQRVGLARAFAGSPRLVLADEPTGQQDRETAEEVMDAIAMIADLDRTTMVVATHDPAIAARFDTRWTMHDGVLSTGAVAWSA
jgi:ABC-type lipoprotein export system ATPase subunit